MTLPSNWHTLPGIPSDLLDSKLPGERRLKTSVDPEIAEWLQFQQQYSIQWQGVNNGAARMSGRRRGVDVAEYWIGINVPQGRQLVIWSDSIQVTEGDYDVDFFDAPDGFTGGTQGVIRCLCGQTGTVQSRPFFGVTPIDTETQSKRFETFIDQGDIAGPARPTASPRGEAVFQIIFQPVLIRIARQQAQSFNVSWNAVVWEEDA